VWNRFLYKLTDFGSAREFDDSETSESLYGTEEYLVSSFELSYLYLLFHILPWMIENSTCFVHVSSEMNWWFRVITHDTHSDKDASCHCCNLSSDGTCYEVICCHQRLVLKWV